VRVTDIEELIHDGLAKYMDGINRLSKTKKSIPQLQQMLDALSIQRTESQRKCEYFLYYSNSWSIQ